MTTYLPIIYNTTIPNSVFEILDAPKDVIDPIALPLATDTTQGAVTLNQITSIVQGLGVLGPAGGDLNGTYPNPNVNQGTQAFAGKLKLVTYPNVAVDPALNSTDATTNATVSGLLGAKSGINTTSPFNDMQTSLRKTLMSFGDYPLQIETKNMSYIYIPKEATADFGLFIQKSNLGTGYGAALAVYCTSTTSSLDIIKGGCTVIKASLGDGVNTINCQQKEIICVNSTVSQYVTNASRMVSVLGVTNSPSTLNIGIYGNATRGTTNYAGYFDGDAIVTGTLTATVVPPSDVRFKENLRSIDELATAMFDVPVYQYDFKDPGMHAFAQIECWRKNEASSRAEDICLKNSEYKNYVLNKEKASAFDIKKFESLKSQTIQNELEKIVKDNLLPLSNARKDCIGVLAQDVEKIAPFMVQNLGPMYLDGESVDAKGLNMSDFIGVLLKQNQMIVERVKSLEKSILLIKNGLSF